MRSERILIGLLITACFVDWAFLVWALRAPSALQGVELALLLAQGGGLLVCTALVMASLRTGRSAEPRSIRAIRELLGEMR